MFAEGSTLSWDTLDGAERFRNTVYDVHVYISPSGSDSNNGLSENNSLLTLVGGLRNISGSVFGPITSQLRQGRSVHVHIKNGVYPVSGNRFDFSAVGWTVATTSSWNTETAPLLIEGETQDGVIFDASRPFTSWTPSGSNQWVHSWTLAMSAQVDPWNGSAGTAQAILYREMIWYNEKFPRQVFNISDLNNYDEAFFVNNANQTITLKSISINPTVTQVYYNTSQTYLNFFGKTNVILRNLTFRGFATYTGGDSNEDYAITFRRASPVNVYKNVLVENCTFDKISGNGLLISHGIDITVKGCVFSNIGWRGLGISYNNNLSHNTMTYIEDCIGYNNNIKGVWDNIVSWDAAVIKNVEASNQIVRRNTFFENSTNAIWWDVSCYNCHAYNNYISENANVGIYCEISVGPFSVKDNIVWKNTAGIINGEIQRSTASENLLVNNIQNMQLRNNGRASYRNYRLTRWEIQNNTFVSDSASSKIYYGPFDEIGKPAYQMSDRNIIIPALEMGQNRYYARKQNNCIYDGVQTIALSAWNTSLNNGTLGPPGISDSSSTIISRIFHSGNSDFLYEEFVLATPTLQWFEANVGSLTPQLRKTNTTIYNGYKNNIGIRHNFSFIAPRTGLYRFTGTGGSGKLTIQSKTVLNGSSVTVNLSAGQSLPINYLGVITESGKRNGVLFNNILSSGDIPIPACFVGPEIVLSDIKITDSYQPSTDATGTWSVANSAIRRPPVVWAGWPGYTTVNRGYTTSPATTGTLIERDFSVPLYTNQSKTYYCAIPVQTGTSSDFFNIILATGNATSYTTSDPSSGANNVLVQYNPTAQKFRLHSVDIGASTHAINTQYLLLFRFVYNNTNNVSISALVVPTGTDVSSIPVSWGITNQSRTLLGDLERVVYRINNNNPRIGDARISTNYTNILQ